MGIYTISEETATLTGGDWECKHHQRTKEKRLRLEAGLEEQPETILIPDQNEEQA
ncbi:MAG: hypothetical protein KAJ29_00995 [Alphaproteobacteria bacterium]|nr:hypothetical protein [Alphaproteobacteria bacterium]